jgi:hypothetical protein
MKAGDFLNKMASKIKKQDHPVIIDLLSRADMQQIEIPDEVANAMVSELMSLEGAKNNSSVKSHFIAEALNGVDAELVNTVNELGIDAEIFKEKKNTYDKVRILREKIKELQEQKSDAKGKEKAELQKTINELNDKLGKTIEDHKKELETTKSKYEEQMLSHLMFSSLKGRNYANKEMPADTSAKIAQILISDELAKLGIRAENNSGALRLKKIKDDTEYYDDNHKPVTYDDFVTKVLADNKLLAVSDPAKGNNPPNPFTGNPLKVEGEKVNQQIVDEITGSMIS